MFKQTVKILVILLFPTIILANETLDTIKEDLWLNGVREKMNVVAPVAKTGEVESTTSNKTSEEKKVANVFYIPEELIRSIKHY